MFSFTHVDEFRLVTGYHAWLGLGNWEGKKKVRKCLLLPTDYDKYGCILLQAAIKIYLQVSWKSFL